MLPNSKDKTIRSGILTWAQQHPRDLPWKDTSDPYRIWVSEIILQQTRVQQGTPYYHRFIETFPNVFKLASASIDDLYKVWEGLGYYRRARHMHEAAQRIVNEFEGNFPTSYDEILSLKGVGPYAAAAIGSFAFGLPHPVIDGNVQRVMARLYGIHAETDSTAGKKEVEKVVSGVFDKNDPATFNQAIMDFGALHCKPQNPSCADCPLSGSCYAWKNQIVHQLPRKKTKKPRKERFFYYLVFRNETDIWIRKREANDVWQHLYEFYLVEHSEPKPWSEILNLLPPEIEVLHTSEAYRQLLTHQQIHASFSEVYLPTDYELRNVQDMMRINQEKLENFAFPKVIDCYLRDNSVTLNLAF
ncbi:MAG: A/G-specific adenine glycosylase [Saprospiraceae bacterium]|nr:A/G-specific adenine glycosylase [Saprospiraceae bacterium]